jgi:aminoglycoside phosphotransferase (APT) family kinase protein
MTVPGLSGYVEVAPVRPGEDLDWAALETYLRSRLPGIDGDFSVLQFPNGSANLTYRVSFDDRHLVVRRPPLGHLAVGAHDMGREYRALSSLWAVYDRAPRPMAYSDDPTIIGAEFLVLEYRSGVVIWGPDTVPEPMKRFDDNGRRIGAALTDALVDLHLVDIYESGLIGLGKPDGFLHRQLRGWRARWDAVSDAGPRPVMDELADRLFARVPTSPAPTVLHNDFKLDNCQFLPTNPDRVQTVFDWDMATVGDPLVDLGTMLNYWPDPDGDDSSQRVSIAGLEAMGLPSRAEIVQRYASATGTDVRAIHWYEAYGCWKTAIIMQQLYARYVRGETKDERMATRADRLESVAARALDLLYEWR